MVLGWFGIVALAEPEVDESGEDSGIYRRQLSS
jgi:hypothetical protein